MPTKEDWIYVAGFLDGEGCITTSNGYTFRITAANTNREILDWLKNTFGGSVNNEWVPKDPRHKNHNMAWKWVIAGQGDLRLFLVEILPHLKMKRKEAELVLNFLNKYTNKQGQTPPDIIKEDYIITKQKLSLAKSDRHYKRGDINA